MPFVNLPEKKGAHAMDKEKMQQVHWLRACLKIRNSAVFEPQAGWRGATKENIPGGSSTEEQRSYPEGIESFSPAVGTRRAGLPWEPVPEFSSTLKALNQSQTCLSRW
jgi:hypothetical protein